MSVRPRAGGGASARHPSDAVGGELGVGRRGCSPETARSRHADGKWRGEIMDVAAYREG